MAAYLLCLSAGGGIPIFTRSHGDVKPLPFPVVGSLNAVHMFAANHGASLKSTTTDNAKIVWRDFFDSLTLIVVTGDDQADDCHLVRLLENVWAAMVLHCGKDELVTIKNLERFKREVKVCFHLLDRLLEGAVPGIFADLTQAADVLLTPDNAPLQSFMEAFVVAADSPYGCLMAEGRVVVATQKWWSLSATELVLLEMLVAAMPPATSRDIPIYLPHGSPTLIHGVEVCVICGPKPTLFDLQGEVVRFWRPAIDILRAAHHVIPRNFPLSIALDQNILGKTCDERPPLGKHISGLSLQMVSSPSFLLVNNETSRCLNTVGVNRDNVASLSMDKRQEILRSFYKKVIGTYFSSPIEGSETGPSEFSHAATDTYIVCDGYKCYALVAGPHQIFVIYSSAIPTYAMRSVTNKTLNSFVKDKSFVL